MEKYLYFTTYGKQGEKGNHIVKALFNTVDKTLNHIYTIDLDGKANMVIETENELITSVENSLGGKLEFYDKNTCKLLKSYQCDYFYSYGQFVDNKILLASYAKGVDSVFDLEKEEITKNIIHVREGIGNTGKSHYIHQLSDGRVVSVDNAYQQLYIYKNNDLELEKIVEFELEPRMNIRLLSFVKDEKYAYLNTEMSNEVLVLDTKEFTVVERQCMTNGTNYFSGGNTISSNDRFLCISVRGENCINVYKVNDNGTLEFTYKFKCGDTPRDLIMIEDYLLACCTEESQVQVYKLNETIVEKVTNMDEYRPITFAMK